MKLLPLRISGYGAVSPAGWGAAEMVAAVRAGAELPLETITRTAGARPHRVRRVPRPLVPLAFGREPRLRRSSPISGFVVAAALEALGPKRVEMARDGSLNAGVIVVLLNGGVTYSRRFYSEVLEDPATASPLLFPETVFNAPASHLATLLGINGMNYTMVGDTAAFIAAFDLASLWLEGGAVGGVLVIAAEEADWLSGEAAALIDRGHPVAEGAGAVYLEAASEGGVWFQPPVPIGPGQSRRAAAHAVREAWRGWLREGERHTLLCDGLVGSGRADAIEASVFVDWDGPRLSPGGVLGDGLGARGGWQCVVAAAAVAERVADQALVTAIGGNQQALGLLLGGSAAGQR